jgi:hypothetical protein
MVSPSAMMARAYARACGRFAALAPPDFLSFAVFHTAERSIRKNVSEANTLTIHYSLLTINY